MGEFAINASISETTWYAPFELNGGYMPSMLKEIRNDVAVSKGVREFADMALSNLIEAHDAIIEARTLQTHHANKSCGEELLIAAGDLVYLSTKNINLPKGRAHKLCPKFIGPYKVLKAHLGAKHVFCMCNCAIVEACINRYYQSSQNQHSTVGHSYPTSHPTLV